MVHRGPSSGCHACRKRKILCDQSVPGCQRCLKIGVVCPGYRSAGDRTFRNATKATPCGGSILASNTPQALPGLDIPLQKLHLGLERATGKGDEIAYHDSKTLQLTASSRSPLSDCVAKGSSEASQIDSGSNSTNRNSSMTFAKGFLEHPSLAYTPGLPFRSLLLENLFYHYTLPPTEFDPQGFMPFLSHLYADAADDSCLKLAVEATALANAAYQWRLHDQLTRARFYYGQALAALNAALHDAEKAIGDATLCTLMVLTIYENITSCVMRPFGSHQDGYASLLLLRQTFLVNTPYSACLSYHVALQLQLTSLRLRTRPHRELHKWLKTMGTASPASNLRLHCHRASEVCATASEHLQDFAMNGIDTSQLWTLMRDCEKTDEELQTWYEIEGLEMERLTLQGASVPQNTGRWRASTNIAAANTLVLYRGTRIILQETFLECVYQSELHLVPGTAETPSVLVQKRIGSVDTINNLITGIIYSIPFVLAPVDAEGRPAPTGASKSLGGLLLMWSLGVICKCPFASTEQKQFAVHTLEHIGHGMGIRRALALKQLWSGDLPW